MKNLKKYLAILLTLAMMVGLMAACAPEIPAPPAPGTTVETTKAPSSNDNGGGNTPADNPSGNEGQGDTPPATTGETVYDKYEKGTSLRMGVGYNNVNTGIAFDAGTAGEGITLRSEAHLGKTRGDPGRGVRERVSGQRRLQGVRVLGAADEPGGLGLRYRRTAV